MFGWLRPKRYEVKAWQSPADRSAGKAAAHAIRCRALDEAKRHAGAIVEGMAGQYVAVVYKDGHDLIGFQWKGRKAIEILSSSMTVRRK